MGVNMQPYEKMKDEMVRISGEESCCRSAELSALVRVNGTLIFSGGNRIKLMLKDSSAAVARRTVSLLAEAGCREVELVVRMRQRIHKSNSYIIRINSDEKARELLTGLDIFGGSALTNEVPRAVLKKKCCMRAYLRGVFLGAGYLGKPAYGHHLEIAVENLEFAESVMGLMRKFDMKPKVIERRSYYVVYLKDGDDIVQFLNVAGAHTTLLDFENQRVMKAIRNEVNRIVNAEQANLGKTIDASVGQVEDIRLVMGTVGLNSLSAPLREAALARLRNPDATIAELGAGLERPIGKSGMNHRLRRLSRLASKLREEHPFSES